MVLNKILITNIFIFCIIGLSESKAENDSIFGDHHHALLHDTLDDVERRRLLQRIHPLRVLRHLRSVCLRFHLRVQVVVPRRVPEPLHLVLLHRLRPAQFQGERGDDADRRQDRRQHDEQRGEQRGYGPGR